MTPPSEVTEGREAEREICFCGETMELVRLNGEPVGYRCPECGQCVAGTSSLPHDTERGTKR